MKSSSPASDVALKPFHLVNPATTRLNSGRVWLWFVAAFGLGIMLFGGAASATSAPAASTPTATATALATATPIATRAIGREAPSLSLKWPTAMHEAAPLGPSGERLAVRRPAAETLVVDFTSAITEGNVTAATPRTYMGQAFNAANPGGALKITRIELVMASLAAVNYTDIIVNVQLWDSYNAASTPVFAGPTGGVLSFSSGPFNAAADTLYFISLPLPVPVSLSSLTNKGIVVNYRGNTGSGYSSTDNLTSGLRGGAAPPYAIGSVPQLAAPEFGYYRNASGRTDFNFNSTDARALNGVVNNGLLIKIFADPTIGATNTPSPTQVGTATATATQVGTATATATSIGGVVAGNLRFLTNPVRVVDTRGIYTDHFSGVVGGGAAIGYQPNGLAIAPGAFGNGETRVFKIANQGFGAGPLLIPADITGVLVNVSIVQPVNAGTGGYTVVYPGDATTPTTATVNPSDPVNVGSGVAVNQNFAVVATAPSPGGSGANPGAISVTSFGQAGARDIVIDLVGYYSPSAPAIGSIRFIPPVRVLDTRGIYNALGDFGGSLPIGYQPNGAPIGVGPIISNTLTTYGLANRAFGTALQGNQITFPANTAGILAHITTVQTPGQGGYTTLLPGDATLPVNTATLNPANEITFNSWANGLPAAGTFAVFSTNRQDVIVDVMGYVSVANPPLSQTFFNPVRVVDTRGLYTPNGDPGGVFAIGYDETGVAISPGQLPADTTRRYRLNGKSFGTVSQGNVVTFPSDVKGALMNVTIVQPAPSGGFLTIFPGDASPAGLAATVNPSLKIAGSWWASGVPVVGGFAGSLGAFSAGSARDLVIDAAAYFR